MNQSQPTTMRSLAIENYGKPQDYEIFDLPVPEIKSPDELLIKVHAASINPIDVKIATGMAKMFWPSQLPFKIGYDLSGTVVAAGSAVPSHLQPGAIVFSRVPEKCRGTASEYALSIASATALKPASLSHVEAAAMPLAALTALQALDAADKFIEGGLKGKTVYIPAGLSGTGSFAAQLAKNVFQVGRIITTLSTAKIEKAESLLGKGVVDEMIDYTKDDPTKVINRGSVDVLFDTMGIGLGSLHLMKKGGIIVTISSLPFGPELKRKAPHMPALMRWTADTIGKMIQFRAGRYGVEYRPILMKESAEDLDRLSKCIEEGNIRSIVGRVATFTDLEMIREGCLEVYNAKGGIGKFVIDVEEKR